VHLFSKHLVLQPVVGLEELFFRGGKSKPEAVDCLQSFVAHLSAVSCRCNNVLYMRGVPEEAMEAT